MVVYAGAAGLVLDSTPGDRKRTILDAIERLGAGGSTAGAAGIVGAYEVAQKNFIKEGNNRVILATDGDFNVGVTNDDELVRLIEEKRKSGVFLTVLGVGEGNLQDAKMEKLADHGNGNYAYLDDLLEAQKVLVHEMGGTLFTIAKDVKIQVEFNPARVASYRLIGYENRMLAKEDFADDKKDAGELGSGHTVTALYQIEPARKENASTDFELRYVNVGIKPAAFQSDELLTVRFRYKDPDQDKSRLIEETASDLGASFAGASMDFRFAAAVAELGMILRDSEFKGMANFAHAIETARATTGRDPNGYRAEFVELAERCRDLKPEVSER
jgi:Ca-activated chloride channel family protein